MPARFPWKQEESGRSSPGTRNRAALTSLPAVEERGWSSLGTGLRRRAGDFIAGAGRGGFFCSALEAEEFGFGRNDGNSGARGVEARQRGGQGAHVATRQLTRRRRRRLTHCNSCVGDEWVHERGRIEHKPYFIRRSTGFSEI
jgi:hypothetical protein